MNRPLGFMGMELYRKVIDEISDYSDPVRSKEIELFHFGESLLHPRIHEMVGYAANKDLNVSLSVNAPMLTPILAERILANGLSRLIVSLDGHDQESYQKIRGKAADYEKATHNVKSLIALARRMGSEHCICLRIIQLKANEAFVREFAREWRENGIEVDIRPFFPWTEKEISQLGIVEKYPPFMPCPFPWQYLVVQWDGTVVPCCRDYNSNNALGNVKHMSLKEIWNSTGYFEFRQQHRTGKYGRNIFCSDCMDIYYTEHETFPRQKELLLCRKCAAGEKNNNRLVVKDGCPLDLDLGIIAGTITTSVSTFNRYLTRTQCAVLFLSQKSCCFEETARKMAISVTSLMEHMTPLLEAQVIEMQQQARPGRTTGQDWTIPALWSRALEKYRENPLIIAEEDGSLFTYGDAHEVVTMAALRLASADVRKGDRICLVAPQHPEAVLLFWAAAQLGAIVVPLDFRLPKPILQGILADILPRLIFCDYNGAKNILKFFSGECILFDDNDDLPLHGLQRFSEWLEDIGNASPFETSIEPEDAAVILFTSGTTGRPKGVVLSHGALCRSGALLAGSYQWRSDDVFWGLGDYHTMSGLRNPSIAALYAGCSILTTPLESRSNALLVTDSVSRHRVTILGTVPAMLRQFNQFADRVEKANLSSLRQVICTGSTLSSEVSKQFQSFFRVPLFNYYGLTETCGFCAGKLPGDLATTNASIGYPVDSLMRIEGETGNPLPAGETGELLIYSENLMLGYYQALARTQQALLDGWYRTGDLARREADGSIVLVGRKDEAIKNVSGELVYPQEIEEVLEQSGQVAEAAVCGFAGNGGEEQLVAFILAGKPVANQDAFIYDLRRMLHEKLGAYKVPARFLFVPELPKGTNGKLLRQKLKEMC